MIDQRSFALVDIAAKKRRTMRDVFLAKMGPRSSRGRRSML
jgi:hypothetical protein